jgi:hypothetical protein
MFSKKLTELTPSDIQNVVDKKIQEDQEIEFKVALPTRDGTDDKWITSQEEIGIVAKRYIAKVLIAFANTLGGTLILGEGEDGEDRACEIKPLPQCRELADRLAASVASSTDPKLYGIEYAGVEINGDVNLAGICSKLQRPAANEILQQALWLHPRNPVQRANSVLSALC